MATPATVLVSYPLEGNWADTQRKLESVAKRFKGTLGGSGAGVGMTPAMRDLEFCFETYKEAKAAEKAMKGLKIKDAEFV